MKEEYLDITNILKLLSNDTRLSVLALLQLKNCNIGEFCEIFDISQPAISRHIRMLKNAGLINEKRKGLWTVYSLNKKNIYFPLIQEILQHFPNQKEKLDWLEEQGLRIIYD